MSNFFSSDLSSSQDYNILSECLSFLLYFLLGMTSDQVCSLPSFFSASGKDHPPEEHAEETYIGSYLDDSDMEQFVGFLSLQDVHTKQVYWTGCEFVVCFLISDSASVISSTSASPVRLSPRLLRPLPPQRPWQRQRHPWQQRPWRRHLWRQRRWPQKHDGLGGVKLFCGPQ